MSRQRRRKHDRGKWLNGTISTYSFPVRYDGSATNMLILLNVDRFCAWLPCGLRHALAIFAVAKETPKAYPAVLRVGKNGEKAVRTVSRIEHQIMDEHVQKSCWGLTAKAVIGVAGIILLAWLVSGADKVAMVAAG